MVGSKRGLATLLKERINPEIINIHCLAHRLELSFRVVFKTNKLYDKLMTLLIGLHYFYKKQYKNKSGLLRTMKALEVKGTFPPKVTGTRWLPHLQRGIKSLITTYKAYEAHLSNISHENPKAEGLAKLLLDKHVISFAIFLKDVLDPLMRLSLKQQAPESNFADSLFRVETTADMLGELKERHGSDLHNMTWGQLHDKELPLIMLVMDLMLTLPPTSVTCETTFSQLKLIKTARRTRLNPSTLNDLLTVKLQPENITNFNPEPAIDNWLASALKPFKTYQL